MLGEGGSAHTTRHVLLHKLAWSFEDDLPKRSKGQKNNPVKELEQHSRNPNFLPLRRPLADSPIFQGLTLTAHYLDSPKNFQKKHH